MNNFNNEQVELFICRLIDKYEGTIITEEFLQDQYVKLLNEQKNQLSSSGEAVVGRKIAKLIDKWDEKRIDLLHFRRVGKIEGGIERSQLMEKFINDLKELSNFSG